jgi:hypothetical protein
MFPNKLNEGLKSTYIQVIRVLLWGIFTFLISGVIAGLLFALIARSETLNPKTTNPKP